MKALTLTQPWATLMALGPKKVETRNWKTSYHGPLAIHAAKAFPGWAKEWCQEEPFRIYVPDPDVLPCGAVLAVVNLYEVMPTAAACERIIESGRLHELAFGNYAAGRFAFFTALIETFPTPIPAKGALGLWEWEGLPT